MNFAAIIAFESYWLEYSNGKDHTEWLSSCKSRVTTMITGKNFTSQFIF